MDSTKKAARECPILPHGIEQARRSKLRSHAGANVSQHQRGVDNKKQNRPAHAARDVNVGGVYIRECQATWPYQLSCINLNAGEYPGNQAREIGRASCRGRGESSV